MRILCDVDGVCCNFIESFLRAATQVTGKQYLYEDVKEWEIDRCLKLTPEEYEGTKQIMYQPGWVHALASYPGSYLGIAAIEKMGHEVVFATSPWKKHPTWSHERYEWIQDRWPDREVISTHAKYMIVGDVLIDDKPSNVSKWVEHCHERRWHNGLGAGLLMDQPWNEGRLTGGLGVHRVFNWNDIVSHIRNLTK